MVPFRDQNSSTIAWAAVFNVEYCRAFQAQNISNSYLFTPLVLTRKQSNSVIISLVSFSVSSKLLLHYRPIGLSNHSVDPFPRSESVTRL